MQHTQNQFSHSEAKAKFTSTFLKLLQSRNVGPEFLSWDLKTIGDITNLFDLETAAIRLLEAIKNNEKIAVYGDYDVDGTTSCALLFHFFKFFNLEVDLIQPSRFIEGYGVHVSSIDEAINRNVDVLITVDCGITGHDAAEYAKHRGLDLIITDHHADANETLPEAFAIINPNRKDETCPSELKALAGVGVAFALALKMKQLFEQNPDNEKPLPSLYPLLQFLAVGTISDLAPINTLNARLIRHGLKQLPKSQYQGLRQFLSPEEKKLEVLPSEKVSFNIGPLINSKGRLEHPEQALQLLTYSDPNDCFELYNVLNESNSERKHIQSIVAKEAKAQLLEQFKEETPLIAIVYAPEWHEGVIGIVASKLVEEFQIPAIVFTDAAEEGVIKGSARTAGELNIHQELLKNNDLFLKFGGHKAAAGLSLKKENLNQLRKNLSEQLKEIPEIIRMNQVSFDQEIKLSEVSPKLIKELELLEPFGNHNPRPTFKIVDFKLQSFKLLNGGHVKWNFITSDGPQSKAFTIGGISFFFADKWNKLTPEEIYSKSQSGQELAILGQLGFNHFRGNIYMQIMVNDIVERL